ncbi:hypothetical protein JG688_00010885 [Phytophthora aleatoria]|uniref:Jacalin-type lectin domain-containing protein n=1 Tax=Phytophthora aleatoria TaxID=2496075 RepID=A0A8J5M5M9_9STRA|nr:hypothetical protein JG688_00010885 [Phytophthora aleatoria]
MSGQKVLSINLRAAERVDAVILTIVNPSGEESTLYHGGGGGDLKTPLALAEGEYITVMEAHAVHHQFGEFYRRRNTDGQDWNGHCEGWLSVGWFHWQKR